MNFGLTIGKVVDVHPEHFSVDIRLAMDNRRLVGVPMVGLAITGNTGIVDLPIPDLTTPRTEPEKWKSFNTNQRDILAIVGWVDGSPVCLGFLPPPLCELNFEGDIASERRIERHASDVYRWTDQNGDQQMVHPSGSYISFGEQRDFLDLTARDYDQKWQIRRNTTRRPGVRCVIASGGHSYCELDIDSDGNIVLRTDGNLDAEIGGDAAVHVHGNANVAVVGDLSTEVGGDLAAQVGGKAQVDVDGDIEVSSSGAVTVEAADTLLAKAGGDLTL